MNIKTYSSSTCCWGCDAKSCCRAFGGRIVVDDFDKAVATIWRPEILDAIVEGDATLFPDVVIAQETVKTPPCCCDPFMWANTLPAGRVIL